MKKLSLKKTAGYKFPESYRDYLDIKRVPVCQVEIPGMGRLRTGKQHLNFHITQVQPVKRDQPAGRKPGKATSKRKIPAATIAE